MNCWDLSCILKPLHTFQVQHHEILTADELNMQCIPQPSLDWWLTTRKMACCRQEASAKVALCQKLRKSHQRWHQVWGLPEWAFRSWSWRWFKRFSESSNAEDPPAQPFSRDQATRQAWEEDCCSFATAYAEGLWRTKVSLPKPCRLIILLLPSHNHTSIFLSSASCESV